MITPNRADQVEWGAQATNTNAVFRPLIGTAFSRARASSRYPLSIILEKRWIVPSRHRLLLAYLSLRSVIGTPTIQSSQNPSASLATKCQYKLSGIIIFEPAVGRVASQKRMTYEQRAVPPRQRCRDLVTGGGRVPENALPILTAIGSRAAISAGLFAFAVPPACKRGWPYVERISFDDDARIAHKNPCSRVPIPSIDSRSLSPDFRNVPRDIPTPNGVPVKITSPG